MSLNPSSSSTTSAIVATTDFGSHVLRINGYSRTKGIPSGVSLTSCSFRVGGHSWHLAYFPNGVTPQSSDFISVFLNLEDAHTNGCAVLAQFDLALLDRAGKPAPTYTKTGHMHRFCSRASFWGFNSFIRREALEKSRHLKEDAFCIRCDLTVVTRFHSECEADAAADANPTFVHVPPPELSRSMGDLLQSGQGADVTFRVDGETFAAHRGVLAVRSPVFQAQLFGGMKEAAAPLSGVEIEVPDMRADVFMNLLHFIYTDALPEPKPQSSQEEDQAVHMAQHLLVAADRYGMQRLKLICEHTLCRHIDVNNAATTLALAEQHRCPGLKEACFQFLKKSPVSLNHVMNSGGYDHLATSCPSVIKELMARLAAK